MFFLCSRFAPLFLLLTVLYHLLLPSSAHGSHGSDRWAILKDFAGPFESTWELWVYAISSTAFISAAPFFILCCIPIRDASEHSSFLKVLLSFASGGLLGDAFLHLIPHAVSPHDHHHHHDDEHEHHHHDDHNHEHHHGDAHDHTQDMLVGLWVLAGIVVFLMVEKFVRLAKGGHQHSHGSSHGKMVRDESIEEKDEARVVPTSSTNTNVHRRKTGQQQPSLSGGRSASSNTKTATKQNEIKVSAYLNLAADFTHNFTDGLAISASYLAGRHIGLITTLTILLHEVPHEIGDFAILIQSGYSKRRAMFVQLVTAVGAMTGTFCGLFAEGIGTAATAWILPFTAGGFIYIATVAVIPELLEDSSLWQSVKEIFAIFVGVGMMVLIAYIE